MEKVTGKKVSLKEGKELSDNPEIEQVYTKFINEFNSRFNGIFEPLDLLDIVDSYRDASYMFETIQVALTPVGNIHLPFLDKLEEFSQKASIGFEYEYNKDTDPELEHVIYLDYV